MGRDHLTNIIARITGAPAFRPIGYVKLLRPLQAGFGKCMEISYLAAKYGGGNIPADISYTGRHVRLCAHRI